MVRKQTGRTTGVVPYIGTWIETPKSRPIIDDFFVVPYIGTWIETKLKRNELNRLGVVPYIGTWIETFPFLLRSGTSGRTLYRYVD